MASIQPNTHSFIVKIWLVESSDKQHLPAWRGRITHVPSGDSFHFADVNELPGFLAPYLLQLGIKPTRFGKLRQWLRR